jgi:transposase
MIRTAQGNRPAFLLLLRQMVRRLRGYTLWLYVDGAAWHKGDPVEKFLEKHSRLHLQYLPPYHPDLNPQERIWRQLRYEAMTNRWFETLDQIWNSIHKTTCASLPKKIRRLCNIR